MTCVIRVDNATSRRGGRRTEFVPDENSSIFLTLPSLRHPHCARCAHPVPRQLPKHTTVHGPELSIRAQTRILTFLAPPRTQVILSGMQ